MTCFALLLAACTGDDPSPAEPDGGSAATLQVLDPPGESIGLAYGASATLRVAYTRAGAPIAGVSVTFALIEDPARGESSGGSSLDVAKAVTDDDGVARATVSAGAARVNFRIEASAPEAGVATFYVTVANEGFADLEVTPRHDGAALVDVVELRLYGTALSCAALDPNDPPPSSYPPRSMESFDQPARFGALGAGEAYSVLAWGRTTAGQVLAVGCVDLDPGAVRPASTMYLDVIVTDLPVALAPAYEVTSGFDLGTTLLDEAPVWGASSCPLAAAQVVLDALEPLEAALAARRGVLDADGCRADLDGDGLPSLETAHGATWPAVVRDRLAYFAIVSTLELEGGAATHTLRTITLGAGSAATVELAQTPRPVLVATASFDGTMLGDHGFTLRLDEALATTFAADGIDLAALASSTTDCAAFCAHAGLAPDCLTDACAAALPPLDDALAAPFARLASTELDLVLSSSLTPGDADGDLVAESLSGPWYARIMIDGALTPISGGLSGYVLP